MLNTINDRQIPFPQLIYKKCVIFNIAIDMKNCTHRKYHENWKKKFFIPTMKNVQCKCNTHKATTNY